jgi:D-sedoheptulose 7-phosphate isomerase
MAKYTIDFITESKTILDRLQPEQIDRLAELIAEVARGQGRLFFLGAGGGAGHAGHAVNDFRKIANIECYAPTDNVSELTARINDDGFDTSYANWLKVSRISKRDGVFVFSVGGGNEEKNISVSLVRAVQLAKSVGAKIMGVVGRDGGFTARNADACIVIPSINPQTVTPQVESFQAFVWHLLVSHPLIAKNAMKWESTQAAETT